MTAAVAVGAIDLYQRFISPYKGFCCAHRAVRGRRSCSQFAKRLIEKVGLLRFGPLLARRLRKCGEVARALKAGLVGRRRGFKSAACETEDEQQRRKDQRAGRDSSSRDCGDCGGCDAPDLSGIAGCDAPASAVPVHACDCAGGGCDLSL